MLRNFKEGAGLHLLFIFLACGLLLLSCKVRKPKGVLSEGKMEEILYQYHLLRAVAQQGDSADVRNRAYKLSCLREQGVTEAEFDSSLVWYCQNMEHLQKIYQRIDDRIKKNLASLGAAQSQVNRYSNLTQNGDTANVWNGQSYYLLSNNGFQNRVVFDLKADTAFHPQDRYMLNFQAQFVQKEGPRHAYATLAIQYDNDSVAYTSHDIYASGDNSLILKAVDRPIKRVYGFIYLLSQSTANPRLLFILQPSLIRFHEKPAVTPSSQKSDSLSIATSDTLKVAPADSGLKTALSVDALHSRPVPRAKE